MADRKTIQLTHDEMLELQHFIRYGREFKVFRDGIEVVLTVPPGIPGDVTLTAGTVRLTAGTVRHEGMARIGDHRRE